MSEPFLAEIRIVGFNFAPRGWATCDGQILPINQNQALFSLLGTTYGGDGRTTFALPDLRGRTPAHVGDSGGGWAITQGQKSGEETHTLSVGEIASHTHQAMGSSAQANNNDPTGHVLAQSGTIYGPASSLTPMRAGSIGNAGGGQAHDNMQPYLALNFVIALQGLFPSRN
ncbi:MAG: phage tail protein [Anaerolineae bacterium]|nr:phage tail protein [Anaerolineae bacterium]MCB9132390.1 phage tail protein [Anaerolineales bacterium]MCB0227777.1 phage tail protein [Anaerolineae bacterium]MCB0233194.1 phage tail protein [Anaerolineae bacterium]MCB0237811.1 phage tail protein [Anaerolineae bacterium]